MRETVILGDLCWDVYLGGMKSFPAMGEEVFADDGSMKPGGSAANTAMVMALCGVPVTLFSVVGDDRAGKRIIQDLEGYGLDSSMVSRMAGRQTGFTVVLSYREAAERMLVTSPGTLDQASLADFFPGYLKPGGHLHLSSWFIQSRLAPEIGGLLELARMEGMTTSLDPGHDPGGKWDISSLAPSLEYLDWFLPNEVEFLSITRTDNLAGAMESFAPELSGLVVKAGGSGAYLRHEAGNGVVRFPSVAVEVLDTTCAGDAFNAGFLRALSQGFSPEEAVLEGNRFGAACSTVMGLPRDGGMFLASDPLNQPD